MPIVNTTARSTYKTRFDATITRWNSTYTAYSTRTTWAGPYYFSTVILDPHLSMFEADITQTGYLESVLDWIDGGTAADPDYSGGAMSLWTVTDDNGEKNVEGKWLYPKVSATTMGLEPYDFATGIAYARAAALILSTPSLNLVYGSSSGNDRATPIYTFVRDNVINKILATRARLAYYRGFLEGTHKAFHAYGAWLGLLLNYMKICSDNISGNTDTSDPIATGTPSWNQLLTSAGTDLQNRLMLAIDTSECRTFNTNISSTALIWDCDKYSVPGPGSAGYTSSAGRIIVLAAALERAGIVITTANMQGLTKLFNDVIFCNNDYTNPQFTSFIDGYNKEVTLSNGVTYEPGHWGNVSRWVQLAEYDDDTMLIAHSLSGEMNDSITETTKPRSTRSMYSWQTMPMIDAYAAYAVMQRDEVIDVPDAPTEATVTLSAPSYEVDDLISATVANGPSSTQAWIGLFEPNNTGKIALTPGAWTFLDQSLDEPAVAVSYPVTLTIKPPKTGTFKVRFYKTLTSPYEAESKWFTVSEIGTNSIGVRPIQLGLTDALAKLCDDLGDNFQLAASRFSEIDSESPGDDPETPGV